MRQTLSPELHAGALVGGRYQVRRSQRSGRNRQRGPVRQEELHLPAGKTRCEAPVAPADAEDLPYSAIGRSVPPPEGGSRSNPRQFFATAGSVQARRQT